MESLFCIAEAMSEAEIDPLLSFGESGTQNRDDGEVEDAAKFPASSLLAQIQLWLWYIYKTCPPLAEAYVKEKCLDPTPYEEFLHFLNIEPLLRRSVVLTTNYDLLFEYYSWAVRNGTRCSYPLKSGWDYSTLQAGDSGLMPYVNTGHNAERHPEDSTLLVCKLHGSVNFFENTLQGVSRLGICDDVAEHGESVGNSAVPVYKPTHKSILAESSLTTRPAIFMVDAIWSLRERYGNSLVPAIVPPTYAKLQGQPWLRRIWNRAFRAIQEARVILFIGYSMPPSDGFMRAMFQGAIASRDDGGPEMYVINPFTDGADGSYYTELFPKLRDNPGRMITKTFAQAWASGDLQEILHRA